jgi:uncharacterized membrane protein YraQ (UPF0718 family)
MWLDVTKSFFTIAIELTLLFIGILFLISLLQGVIPYKKIEQKLTGKNRFVGALFALLFAFITPFCSCSTIPVVVNMLKEKMPFGIVMIFLFASPVLDPTILTIMGVILGWKVTLIYTVATAVFSVIIGFALGAMGLEREVKSVVMTGFEERTNTFSFKTAWLKPSV